MSLTQRQIRREREILHHAMAQTPPPRKRSVPISLFAKLLDAADYALANGYREWSAGRRDDSWKDAAVDGAPDINS